MKTRASIYYYGDGSGNRIRREWRPQCPAKPILMGQQCQGVLGDEGDHWCCAPDGSYQWSYNGLKKLRPHDAAGGRTPPGHTEYPAPASWAGIDQPVKDAEVIAADPRRRRTSRKRLRA